MNSKWFYGALFVLLVTLGVQMDRNLLSKQEIALQFAAQGFHKDNAHLALTEVKTQLQKAGATDIQIVELDAGQLKITYSSRLSVAQIQQLLVDAGLILHQPLNAPQVTNHEELTAYQLDVYELQESGSDLDIEGAPIVEVQIKEHLTNPVGAGISIQAQFDLDALRKANKNQIPLPYGPLKSRHVYLLPEVRAGPIS